MKSGNLSKGEEILRKRLELLERKHNSEFFSVKRKIESEMKKDFQEPEMEEVDGDFKQDIKEKPLYIASLKPPKKVEKVIEKEIENEIDTEVDKVMKEEVKESEEKVKGKVKEKEEDFDDSALIGSVRKHSESIRKIKQEVSKIIVGQEKVIDGLIRGLICNGHVLLEGVPGVAKTLAIRALGQVTGCSVKRVQFTVDLLPTDITGITSYTPGKGFEVIKGPVFANFIIADEINRSPPKTQSALLEAMQEKQVTIGKTSFELPNPFFVMATKNPLENTGVYPLPEAQADRFLFNIMMGYPTREEEISIMEENINLKRFDDFKLKAVINPKNIVDMQELVKKIYLGDHIKSYIVSIVEKTRDRTFKLADCVAYGSSPRASIALFIASKAKAMMEGRCYVIPEDVRDVCFDVLRHRIILSYKASIKGVDSEQVIREILEEVRV